MFKKLQDISIKYFEKVQGTEELRKCKCKKNWNNVKAQDGQICTPILKFSMEYTKTVLTRIKQAGNGPSRRHI